MGTLYLVATPIGNLEDISLRALRLLGEVRLIAAEDTRHTRKLLSHHRLHTPLISYHEHNKLTRLDQVLAALDEGDVALVSDAGTPGLNDPGYELVRAALQAGHRVSPIPGPSALTAALVASGLPTDSFVFLGYLPRRVAERRKALRALATEPRTMVAFEAPHRLRASLRDLEQALGSERVLAVCRELTKVHEEIFRGTLSQACAHFAAQAPRGEVTLVIGGAERPGEHISGRWPVRRVQRALAAKRAEGLSRSEAARQVAAISGWTRRDLYALPEEDS
ncbi:MAG: 16S rRNA (cytidine(1402)-2'-O)-methyltransferase [Chloroflexota bacterium]